MRYQICRTFFLTSCFFLAICETGTAQVFPPEPGLAMAGKPASGVAWRRTGPLGALPSHLAFAAGGEYVWLTTRLPYGSNLLYFSPDRGEKWRRVDALPHCGVLDDLVTDPIDPQVAWVLCDSRALRTEDAGASWEVVFEHFENNYRLIDLAITPSGQIYTVAGPTLFRFGTTGLLPILGNLESFQVYTGPDGSLWATTRFPNSDQPPVLRRSQFAGGAWEEVGPLEAKWLVIDPVHPQRLWAWASAEGRLVRSDDGGGTFLPVGEPLAQLGQVTVGQGVLFAVVQETVNSPRSKLHRSVDGGATWQVVQGLAAAAVSGVVGDGHQTLLALANSFETLGLLRSLDGGTRWHQVGRGLDAAPVREVAFLAGAPTEYVALTEGGFLYRQLPRGAFPERLAVEFGRLSSVVVDPFRRDQLWIATPDAVLRTVNGGRSWQAVSETPTAQAQLESHPQQSGMLFAVSQESFYPCGALHRSADSGENWRSTGTRLDAIWRIVTPIHQPRRLALTGEVCSCSRSCDGELVAAESVDRGRHWAYIDLPGSELVFSWSPTHPDVALLATTAGLFRRPASSEAWQQIDNETNYLDLVAGKSVLYALVGDGNAVELRVSTDDGTNWQPFGPAFSPQHLPGRLEVRAGVPDRLLAVTAGSVLEITGVRASGGPIPR